MSPEPRRVSEVSPKESLGSLSGCLVDGDAEQRTRERRVKRRALAISIFLQSAVLAALILVPLFGKGSVSLSPSSLRLCRTDIQAATSAMK